MPVENIRYFSRTETCVIARAISKEREEPTGEKTSAEVMGGTKDLERLMGQDGIRHTTAVRPEAKKREIVTKLGNFTCDFSHAQSIHLANATSQRCNFASPFPPLDTNYAQLYVSISFYTYSTYSNRVDLTL